MPNATVVIHRQWSDQPRRRSIECLCSRSAVGSSLIPIRPAVDLEAPSLEASAGTNNFSFKAQGPEGGPGFEANIQTSVLAWSGALSGTSVSIVTANGDVHRMHSASDQAVSLETLSHGDAVVVLSGGLTFGLQGLDDTLSMALCDRPSPSSSCSWILDAAEDQRLPGIHFVGLWVPRSGSRESDGQLSD